MKLLKLQAIQQLDLVINKSNSEVIPENLLKNESFKEFRRYQKSLNVEGTNKNREDSKEHIKSKNYK